MKKARAYTPKIIREQPGYAAGRTLQVAKSKTGGYRLYALIEGKAMDASLADVPGLERYEGWRNKKSLGIKTKR